MTAVAVAWLKFLPCKPLIVTGTTKPERVAQAVAGLSVPLTRTQWSNGLSVSALGCGRLRHRGGGAAGARGGGRGCEFGGVYGIPTVRRGRPAPVPAPAGARPRGPAHGG